MASLGGAAHGGAVTPGAVTAVDGGPPAAFIMHHTGGRGTVAGVQETLRQRGLGVQYVMDREGNITQTGGPGSQDIRDETGPYGTALGRRLGLSSKNTVGMKIIAKDDADVTAAASISWTNIILRRQFMGMVRFRTANSLPRA